MIKKIAILAFLSFSILNANIDVENTLEDKFASCEKAYDDCLTQCEEKESSYDECSSQCETRLYECQSAVEEALENSKEELN